ncbi:MAG: ACP S-malonyltransferase [Hyphomicrobiaceae bacterium]|nr:ACP S-malonyltransferase [Hyphomicrobiaceae bacterium]
MRALLFPGQGSQALGMGTGLFERYPDVTAAADAILGYSIAELCLAGPAERLARTRWAQPAIYVVNALHLRDLIERGEAACDFAAGHSLGEYNALAAAGVFDFATGLALVNARARAFEAAGDGAMAAVLGLTARQVRAVLDAGVDGDVDIANLNTRTQIVLAGPAASLDRLAPALEAAGAARVQRLAVSGAFHSRHMRPARTAMAAILRDAAFADPRFPVIANVTARPYLRRRVADFLTEQIVEPVRWHETLRCLIRNGVVDLLEVGHGGVLTRIVNAVRREDFPPPLAPAASPVGATI